MHRGNLPTVFEVASVDAELLEQRPRRKSMAIEPCDCLACPLGTDLHVRLLASGDAHHTRVSPCRLAADVIVLVRPCIAGVASSHWRLLAMLSRRDALTRDVFPIKLTQL